MDNTINYNLIRPAPEDFYNIQEFNDNMTIIDTELKNLENGKAPSGHGLGDKTADVSNTSILEMLKNGCGFYTIAEATDTPYINGEWLSVLQLSRQHPGVDDVTGGQLAFYDFLPNNPKMWLRTSFKGTAGKWVEMLHTGNLPNYANTRMQSNSYVGTGVGGEDAPNRLTFEFVPKLVIVSAPANEGGKIIAINGQSSVELVNCGAADVNTSNIANIYLTWSGKSVSWYVTYGSNNEKRSTYQLNRAGVTYHWVAFA